MFPRQSGIVCSTCGSAVSRSLILIFFAEAERRDPTILQRWESLSPASRKMIVRPHGCGAVGGLATWCTLTASSANFPNNWLCADAELWCRLASTGEDDSLALKKKVTIDDLFGPDLQIHDPDAKWLSGEENITSHMLSNEILPNCVRIRVRLWLIWTRSGFVEKKKCLSWGS